MASRAYTNRKQAWKWFPKLSIIIYTSQVSQFVNLIKINQRGLRLVSQGNLNSTVHWLCLAHEATSTYDQIQSREFLSSFYAYMSLCEYPQSFIHQDLKFGLKNLTSQVIWLNWRSLRYNVLCVFQMKMTPRENVFLTTIWTTFMFIKNPF